jgi:hypothetical protein
MRSNLSFQAVEKVKRCLELLSLVRIEAEESMALGAIARQALSEDIEGCICAAI